MIGFLIMHESGEWEERGDRHGHHDDSGCWTPGASSDGRPLSLSLQWSIETERPETFEPVVVSRCWREKREASFCVGVALVPSRPALPRRGFRRPESANQVSLYSIFIPGRSFFFVSAIQCYAIPRVDAFIPPNSLCP